MTILPKKKTTKERQENNSSRSHGTQPPGTAQYSVLGEAIPQTSQNQGTLETPGTSHLSQHVAGPSRARIPNGPPSPSPLLVQFDRSKKQKLFSENQEPDSDDSRDGQLGLSRQIDQAETTTEAENACNSDDERNVDPLLSQEEMVQKEIAFGKLLKEKRGFIIKHMKEDGACLFRAVADQVFGDEEMHDMVRRQCLDYMERNEDYFCQYITEDFGRYISRKRVATSHGNHIEIQAMSEVYNRRIEVYQYDIDPINVFQGSHPQENAPIRVSYHQKSHYNSLVDPYAATVGVGLGMPNLQPGLAEKTLVSQAVGESERDIIEKQMLEDKLLASDWEATGEAIEQQIAQESYLEWLKHADKQPKKDNDTNAPSTSSVQVENDEADGHRTSPTQSPHERHTEHHILRQLQHLPPALFGLSDWDEEEDTNLLAQVLAASQAEYLESLKPKDESK